MPAPSRDTLRVNALKRLVKEYELYLVEKSQQEEYVKQLEAASDDYDLRRARLVLNETARVIPSVRERIATELAQVKELKLEGEEAQAVQAAVTAAERALA